MAADPTLCHPPEPPEGLLQTILSSAVDYAVVALDDAGTVVFWSKGAQRLFGWTAAEIVGHSANRLFMPDDQAIGVLAAEMQAARERGRGADDRWHVRKDGSRFWARGEVLPLIDHANRRIGFVKIVRDRTAEWRLAQEKEAAARATEDVALRLRLAMVAGRMASFELELGTDILHGSPELNRILGYPEDAAPSAEQIRQNFYPGERERLQALSVDLPPDEARFIEVEFRYIRPDTRQVRWLWLRAEIQQSGAQQRYLGVLFDISDRKFAEQARQESQTRLQMAMEAGRMAVWDYDIATETVTGSAELNRLLGVSLDHNLSIEEIRANYYDGDLERVRQEAQARLARGERFIQSEYRYQWPDGSVHWHLLRAEVLFFGGAPVKLVGIVIDITDWRQAEEDLRQREKDLQAALAAGSLALYTFNNVTRELNGSPRLNEIFGYPPQHRLTLEDMAARHHPEDLDRIARQFSTVLDPNVHKFEMEFRLLMPDGTVRWINARGDYLRDEHGRALQSRGIIMDATDRRQWEEQQRLLIGELNHRVKNTLAIVQAVAQQTLRFHDDPAEVQAALLSRISALAKAHDVLTQEHWRGGELSEVVDRALQPFQGEGANHVTIRGPRIRLPPPTVLSLSLALHELATNAVKYGALSTSAGRVSVEWELSHPRAPQVVLTWREASGPTVTPPTRKGFGSRLLMSGLGAETNAEVELAYPETGVVCTIRFTLASQ
ncbi:PAS domain S-box protein [Jiella sp. M17.18]|uniref:PAS domain-containing sensor histidine kinase n=1 Tax=Jiella sp. M17.18 TaxID=3234247 RepID=UPI0034DF9D1A